MAVPGRGGGPVQPSRDWLVAAHGWQQHVPGHNSRSLFYSDRGSQYASDGFRQVLQRFGIQPSMSRKSDCRDNACSETLFVSLKVEPPNGRKFATLRQAKDETLDWLRWYDRTRLHSPLNYVRPMQSDKDWRGSP